MTIDAATQQHGSQRVRRGMLEDLASSGAQKKSLKAVFEKASKAGKCVCESAEDYWHGIFSSFLSYQSSWWFWFLFRGGVLFSDSIL